MEAMTLEPCPFCGCTDHETSPWRTGKRHESWICSCGNPQCGAEVEAPTPEQAVAKWNRRAHLAQPAQAVDASLVADLREEVTMRRKLGVDDETTNSLLDRAIAALSVQKAGPAGDGPPTAEEWAAAKEEMNTSRAHPDTLRLDALEQAVRAHEGLVLHIKDYDYALKKAPGLALLAGRLDRDLRQAIDQMRGVTASPAPNKEGEG